MMKGYAVVTVDDEKIGRVVVNVSKDAVKRSPQLAGGRADAALTASYYGLAAADPAAPTVGEGLLNPDDPAVTSEEEGRRAGVEPANERRARENEEMGALGKGPLDNPPGGWDRGESAQPRRQR
jgi:hypothetical protein